jgi:gamma-glutamyltranspeptidase/glutathione hydrolase
LARGLLVLEARFGSVPFSSIIAPAERLAGGVPVSPALESDLSVVGNALLADPAAAAVFANPNGEMLQAGDNLSQPDLVSTFEILRTQGILGFYQGSFPGQFTTAANQAGADLSVADIAAALPQIVQPLIGQAGSYQTASLPYGDSNDPRILPASAAFAAVDKNGGVVACAVTMNNLFGTGRIAPGTGILLAASPTGLPVPELRAAIAYRPGDGAFRAAATGTGQQEAPEAVAAGLATALGKTLVQVPDPGRTNIISCPGGVPGGEATCTASADPRGQGLAIGGR